jgi:hypothetical protein
MQITDLCEYKGHHISCGNLPILSSVSSKLRVDSRKQAPSNNAHLYEFNISKPKGKQ